MSGFSPSTVSSFRGLGFDGSFIKAIWLVLEKGSGACVNSAGKALGSGPAQPAHTDLLFLIVIPSRSLKQALEKLCPYC